MKLLLMILTIMPAFVYPQGRIIHRTRPGHIELKWYLPSLFPSGCIQVERSAGHEAWMVISNAPLCFGSQQPSEAEALDPAVRATVSMMRDTSKIKGLMRVAVLLRTFTSAAVSRYMGIYYSDSLIEPHGKYRYRIVSVNDSKVLAASGFISSELYTVPAPPDSISVNLVKGVPHFSWAKGAHRFFGVKVLRKHGDTTICLTPQPLLTNGPDTLARFADASVRARTQYTYGLQSVDFFGDTSCRSLPIVVYCPDSEPPDLPRRFRARTRGKRIELSWRPSSADDLAGYRIARSRSDSYIRDTFHLECDTLFIDSVSHTGLYSYSLCAFDSSGNRSSFNVLGTEAYDNEPPGRPEGLTVRTDTGKVILRWHAATGKDIRGYIVFGASDAKGSKFLRLTPVPVTDTQYIGLMPRNCRNTFFYRVQAQDSSDNKSAFSAVVHARLPDVTPPQPPFIMRGEGVISWLPNTEPDLSGYHLYRKRSVDTAAFRLISSRIIHAEQRFYTDRTMQAGQTYLFYLVATDSAGNLSEPSNVLTWRAPAKQPENFEFGSFSARTRRRGDVQLEWSLRDTSGLSGFIVFRREEGAQWTACTGLIRDFRFSEEKGKRNSTCWYRVKVYGEGGRVAGSDEAEVRFRR